ncbi:ADP-ribose pyrophosphatase domain of DNA damage-and competence-inducible protein CinA (CinA) (PDB:4CT9) (PUBMED:25313401) [Commensalibacter communis]|uniref:competence/damage-inducible protein A n=1 Tax=Commensalibacter communis TaxID=2972786 RepID=UPI0022FF81FD|nr:molybdopterin-binding protein [Commensalibacter communis]CAI3927771.1 ADP-ribose pyrophosphatase domain of DNA damage-and competence-inducible protein CinA (CinA) (PDB:4CT9) (PUBMED:25313401) [Commensalibacter communis]CAI3931546.1 ADP-ribose pyrophosphatase domain of DNA damage-and competence-inducible protein CinA (CinA) (PDB:4CT9) (PUBMED:25313401) [Commensalibacter communis]
MNPTAAIIIIGNEILSGRTQDINLNYIARHLAIAGIKLKEARVIPDDPKVIIHTVNEIRAAMDYVFTTGGIGPTHDDITSDCIAEAFGVPNQIHPETFKLLEDYIGKENFNEARQRMAHLPLGATPIANPVSVAPGYVIGNVYVMAGVPQIMQAMLDGIIPTLRHGDPIVSKTWYAYHASEGKVAADLNNIQNQFPQTDIGSYPFYKNEKQNGVALVAKGQDQYAVEQAAKAIYELLVRMGYQPQEGEPL